MADDTTHPQNRRRRLHPLSWIGWILAVLILAAAAGLAHHAAWLRRHLNQARGHAAQLQLRLNRANRVVKVLTSPHTKHMMLTDSSRPPRPSGEVSWLSRNGALVFVAGSLHPLPQGKSYELWLVPGSGKAPLPAGLFRPSQDHTATVLLPPLPAKIQPSRFLVTVEPTAGSATPSPPFILQWQPPR